MKHPRCNLFICDECGWDLPPAGAIQLSLDLGEEGRDLLNTFEMCPPCALAVARRFDKLGHKETARGLRAEALKIVAAHVQAKRSDVGGGEGTPLPLI